MSPHLCQIIPGWPSLRPHVFQEDVTDIIPPNKRGAVSAVVIAFTSPKLPLLNHDGFPLATVLAKETALSVIQRAVPY
jgi:hypothetical protein